ncbi:Type 1 phosphatases regulator ypi1 [Smittium mucronatum]|uniref:Type 1 phosphatases regulator n=1 Tax=Smittium mucronatum TaxID=133383 RepID=A0A1R0H2T8_9FUNG|nr:Type 1 phosphatases regulator ypi1 [Smittium mucronatum]
MTSDILTFNSAAQSDNLGSEYSVGSLVRPNNQSPAGRPPMGSHTRMRQALPPSAGSLTMTEAVDPNLDDDEVSSSPVPDGVLYLRGLSTHDDQEGQSARPRVRWTSDTVDNEHMGKKKSKVCCIFKKQRNWDESDSEDSDSSCCHDDEPNEYERMPKYN